MAAPGGLEPAFDPSDHLGPEAHPPVIAGNGDKMQPPVPPIPPAETGADQRVALGDDDERARIPLREFPEAHVVDTNRAEVRRGPQGSEAIAIARPELADHRRRWCDGLDRRSPTSRRHT